MLDFDIYQTENSYFGNQLFQQPRSIANIMIFLRLLFLCRYFILLQEDSKQNLLRSTYKFLVTMFSKNGS